MVIFRDEQQADSALRENIRQAYRVDESEVAKTLLIEADLAQETRTRIVERARNLVAKIRQQRSRLSGLDVFLQEYGLSTEEGISLMCLAEALLRIPDSANVDRLIRDKIGNADWRKHLMKSPSLFVNASTWALLLTGKVIANGGSHQTNQTTTLGSLVARSGELVVRRATLAAMRILGRQFVMGQTIEDALDRARRNEAKGYRYSYDMLGEAAMTATDADRYFAAYDSAISAIGQASTDSDPTVSPGISVKLSALHPRYEFSQRDRVLRELIPRLTTLAVHAMEAGIGLTVDAEEADRLDLSLDVFESVSSAPELATWNGLGIVVQAYQKRAVHVLEWLRHLARRHERRFMVRLVKGAYWDAEIKRAQVNGLDGYPVFTRKAATDVSYLACAKRLLAAPDAFYPQFATHNAHTLAAVQEIANDDNEFEFQRLHGMGEALYEHVIADDAVSKPCRIYAPVGSHEDLLPYLVRRLLENGANASFVNRIADETAPIDEIVADPIETLAACNATPHSAIPLPVNVYGSARRNAKGTDLSDATQVKPLIAEIESFRQKRWNAAPTVDGKRANGLAHAVTNPADTHHVVGEVSQASEATVTSATDAAARSAPAWDGTDAGIRASHLEQIADRYEDAFAELTALAVLEAGKTLPDAVSEVREAIDFCRYYALMARREFQAPQRLQGPTGERNELSLHGRGPFVCISPWNFPLAIFTGQVTAALAAGNPVLAKPAEQTPLIAARAVELMHEAGIPSEVLHLLPGAGEIVGEQLIRDPRVAGVAFTGSTETAHRINSALAARGGPIVTLIAETGGLNAMIVDTSALVEQVVQDVLASAFQSAGQRCSALRVLFVQEDIAPKLLDMLTGAMSELIIGNPALLETDIGPVIDAHALSMLEAHSACLSKEAKLLYQVQCSSGLSGGTFFAPRAFEIDQLSRLDREVFGPVLHIIRYSGTRLDAVLDAINKTGYGLTLGIHSRIDETIDYVCRRARVGNIYVNRNVIGAVVGVQPFGGEGLSGTGPKAGGPRYLHRFATERTVSVDTTAAGGNATLLTLTDMAHGATAQRL